MAEQLGLNLPVRTALGRADFLVAPSNALALAMIDRWADWPQGKLALSGPEGSGKTHLAHVWAAATGARIVAAESLTEAQVPDLATGPLVVEDVPAVAGDRVRETALFHLHNMVLAAGHPLLMTGTGGPNRWGLTLPDLQSRVDAAGHAALDPPDDSLLAAILAKLLDDRQLRVKPDLIPYLVARMERSFAAAGDIVAALDTLSLVERRPITRALAARVLDKGATGAR